MKHLLCYVSLILVIGCNAPSNQETRYSQKELLEDRVPIDSSLWHSISFSNRPNIIFIMADDLGYGDLGCYGQKYIKTPNIDALAANGMRFTNFYAASMLCAPSRSALMTGQHTGHTIVRGNRVPESLVSRLLRKIGLREVKPNSRRVGLRTEDYILPEVMKTVGYVTGITGKWGLGEPESEGIPNKQGFDEWLGYLNQQKAHNHYPEKLWNNKEEIIIKENQNQGEGKYSHDIFTEFALDFIDRHQDTTFFLYLPFTLPHDEYRISDQGIYKHNDWEEDEKNYAAMVSKLDHSVGKIQELLGRLHLEESTVIFFCSDNGPAELWKDRFDSSGPLKGKKAELNEGGLRVPMIVSSPGVVPVGTSDELWYLPDILPTIAELTGAAIPDQIDGLSALPLLTGKDGKMQERYLYWEGYLPELVQAGRWKNWKAIRLDPRSPIKLYDLSTDIKEESDVSANHPKIVKRFIDSFLESHSQSPYWH